MFSSLLCWQRKMDDKILIVFITFSYVCQVHTSAVRSTVQQETKIEEVTYVPPTFSQMNITSDDDDSDEDSEADLKTPITETDKTTVSPSPPDSRAFINTAEQWFNLHLGTLALPVPLNKYQELLFKWHVSVYSKMYTPYLQICGASLVTRSVAISAAHCFWDDTAAALLPTEQFAVAAGKRYRKWLKLQLHSSNVSEIIVPPRFLGERTSFQDDIAIVKMATAVADKFLTALPLCVDFGLALERKQLRSGNLGTITGFGLTQENGVPATELNFQRLPYVDIRDCINASEPSYVKYLTGDKICAGDQRSGRAPCRGDSGGGLIFFEGNATFNVPYLRGIASAAPRNNNECNAFAIGSFTHLRKHRTFLREHIPGLEDQCRIIYAKELAEIARNQSISSPDKVNTQTTLGRSEIGQTGVGDDKTVTFVTDNDIKDDKLKNATENKPSNDLEEPDHKVTESTDDQDKDSLRTLPKLIRMIGESSVPEYQWHTAVYSKALKPYLQICGGTLVKTDVVISAAHCFKVEAGLPPAIQFAVAAGKVHRPWADLRDEFAQYSDINQIFINKSFKTIATKLRSCYQHDIAVLTLATPFEYAPGVRPACVDFGSELDREHLTSGSFGKLIGWGDTQHDCAPHRSLHYREMPYVDLGCIEDFSLSHFDMISDSDVCASLDIVVNDARVPAYVRTTPPCDIDSGSGLTYLGNRTSNFVPYLRGVATATIKGNRCNHYVLDSFTHLRAEREFLKAVIPGLEEECDKAYPGLDGREDGARSRDMNRETEKGKMNKPIKEGDKGRSFNNSNDSALNREDGNRDKSRNFNSNSIPSQTAESAASNSGQSALDFNVNLQQVSDPKEINTPVSWKRRNQTTLMNPVSDMVTYDVVESKIVERGNKSEPAFPWHVGVYSKAWTPYMQICGGSLVKRNVVLSAAHCFWSDDFGPQSPAQFAVAAGKDHRPWTDSRDEPQFSHVGEVILPERFVGIKTSYQDDIAIVRLTTPFEYSTRVQPICVDFDVGTEKQQLSGAVGMFAGWGLTANNGREPERLNYVELPYLQTKECIRAAAPASVKYITSDKICLGEQNIGRYFCRSDAGGGLAYAGSYPTIRGISSQAPNGLCDAVTISRFTQVSSHAAFLKEHIWDIERECLDIYGQQDGRKYSKSRDSGGIANGLNFNLVCNCNCDNSSTYRP